MKSHHAPARMVFVAAFSTLALFAGTQAYSAQSKSFRVMTIDIHTIKDGKAVTAHHVEDWAGAIRQLSAK